MKGFNTGFGLTFSVIHLFIFYIFSSFFFYFNIFAVSSSENETLDISLRVLPGDSPLVFWIRVRDRPEKGEIQEGVGAH